MSALSAALASLAVFALVHLVVWRVRRPAGQYLALLGLAAGVLVVALTVRLALEAGAQWTPARTLDYLNQITLFTVLALAYISTYSAVQADSPTMTILLRIAAAGPGGLTRRDLSDDLIDELLVIPRLNDLVVGGMVDLRAGRYVIAMRGALFGRLHARYRAMLRMEKGG
jgi:hypothetical protein